MRALKFAASALLFAAAAFGQTTTTATGSAPYINPWANAGSPGQGALDGIASPGVNVASFTAQQQSAAQTAQGSSSAAGPLNPGSITPSASPSYDPKASNPYPPPYDPYASNPYPPKQYDPYASNPYPPKQYDPYASNPYPQPYDPKASNPYPPKQYDPYASNPYPPKQYDPKASNPYPPSYGSSYDGYKPGYQSAPLVDISPYFNGDCNYSPCLNGGSCYDSSQYAQLSGNTVAAPGQFDTANAGDAESQLSTALAGKPVPNTYSKPQTVFQYQKMSWCKCQGPYYGKFCEKRQCDPNQACSNDPNDQLLVVYPKNVQIECGSYMGATAAGAGAAVAADSCRQATFTTSDRYETGPQNCPESMMIRRSFTGTDRCGKKSQGIQSIAVVDTKPPKVRAKLVPFPPLSVSASQIVLTPEQVKAVVKVLIGVAIEAKKKELEVKKADLLLDPKLKLVDDKLIDKGLFLFDGLNLNGGDVDSFLGSLQGKDLTSLTMSDIFGNDTAALLQANGFDQSSLTSMLTGDPLLSGANAVLSGSPASTTSSLLGSVSSGGGLLGNLFGNTVAGNIAGQITSQAGTPTAIVTVPTDDGFKDWLKAGVALPIGAQVCSQSSTRVFGVKCHAVDKCTPGKRLKAAARLKVTYIVGRRTIGVPKELTDLDPLAKDKLLKDKEIDKVLKEKEKIDKVLIDEHQQKIRDDLKKKLGVDFSKFVDNKGVGPVFDKIVPLSAGAATVVDPSGTASVTPTATSSGGDAVDLSTLMGNRVMDYDAMLQEGGYTTTDSTGASTVYDPKAVDQYGKQYDQQYKPKPYDPYASNPYPQPYDPKASNPYPQPYDPKASNPYPPKQYDPYASNPYPPKQYDPYASNPYPQPYPKNPYDPKQQYTDRVNQGIDPNQAQAFFDSANFKAKNKGTKVFAFQCKTAVAYYPVHCGDVVSVTLDPEDACLAEQFDPKKDIKIDHVFQVSDFKGDLHADLQKKGFSDQSWAGSSSFKGLAVRGTSVELEVLAEDECYNVGKGVDDPARDCETYVSSKCCPPVSNGLSQFAINQVLHTVGADQPMWMSPGAPVQLTDINWKLP